MKTADLPRQGPRRPRRVPAHLRDDDALKTVDFLDALKAHHELTSDYQLAQLMRWPTQRISMYRTTEREFDDDACVQVAHSLGAEPAYVLASIAAARAKREEIKQYWRAAARRLKAKYGAAIAVAVLATSQFAPTPARAAVPVLTHHAIDYATRRRRLRRGSPERRRRKPRTVTARAADPSRPR